MAPVPVNGCGVTRNVNGLWAASEGKGWAGRQKVTEAESSQLEDRNYVIALR